MALYFGFAVSDSMFPEECTISRRPLPPADVAGMVGRAISAVNPSHVPTLEAARIRFGIGVVVPEKAPVINLRPGDEIIVMSVRGLPRLEGRHEYTAEEIEKAAFVFGLWVVH